MHSSGVTDGKKLVEAMKRMVWTSVRVVNGSMYNVEFDKSEKFKDPAI